MTSIIGRTTLCRIQWAEPSLDKCNRSAAFTQLALTHFLKHVIALPLAFFGAKEQQDSIESGVEPLQVRITSLR